MFMKWDDCLSIDDSAIDSEHKEFLSFLDDALVCISDDDINIDIIELMDKCSDYLCKHIEKENCLMVDIKYSDTTTHQKDHDHYIESLSRIIKAEQLKEKHVASRLFVWISAYAHRHINVLDRKLGEQCRLNHIH